MKTYPRFRWACRHVATYTVWGQYALNYYKIVHALPQCDIGSREEVFPSYEQPIELTVSLYCN